MRTIVFLFLIFQIPITSLSQKSAPVAGDAAQLIDLLKKDYSTVDPDNLEEVLSVDRSRVINIFKSYLTEGQKKNELSEEEWFGKLLDDLENNKDNFLKNYLGSNKINTAKLNSTIYKTKLKEYSEAKNKLDELKRLKEGNNISNNEKLTARYTKALDSFLSKQKDFNEARFYKEFSDLTFIYKVYCDDSNTYLSKLLEKFITKYGDIKIGVLDEYAEPNYQSSIQKSIPFLGGDLAFEAVIDGLSRFLAKRIKEELTVYVIKEIQENLNSPNPQSYLNELIVLLPRTADYLRGFEANQVLNFVDEIKQYIEDDFNHLLENAANLRATPRFKKLIENNPDFDFAFEALELIPQLSKLKAPIDYFDYLSNSRNIARWAALKDDDTEKNKQAKYQLANGIRLVSMLAHSITYIDNGETKFVTTDVISDYASELNFYLLYVGFLHQQNIKYYDIDFDIASNKGQLDFEHIMTEVPVGNIDKLKESKDLFLDELGKISENSNKVYTAALAIRKAKDGEEKVDFQKVSEFATSLIDMVGQLSLSADNILDKTNIKDLEIDLSSKLTPYVNIAKKSNEIVLDLHEKKFSNAIIKGIELTSSLKTDGVSLERILALSGHIQNAPNAVLVSNLIKNKSIPEEKDSFRFQIDQLISNCNEPASCKRIKDLLQPLLTAMKDSNEQAFKTARETLVNSLETNKNATLFFTHLVDFNLSTIVVEPIKELATANKLTDTWTTTLITKIDTYAGELINAAIVGGEFNLKKLNAAEEVVAARQEMIQYLQGALPQLTTNLLRVKDENLIKVIHFVNDIALADNEQDVEAAIDAFALPSGSFSLKNERGHFVAINAFPGILAGWEKPTDASADLALGFTAPIGLSTKICEKLGLFVPIIDIAAPVRFRLDGDNDTKALSEFSFENILAPGLYVTYRFGESPFTLSAGFQFAPELAEIIEEQPRGEMQEPIISSRLEESVRYGLGVTIDIPLATLYARKR